MYTKVTKAQIKEFPAKVQEFTFDWMKWCRTRYVTFDQMAGKKLYFAEDMTYTAFRNDDTGAFQCGGEWNGCKPGDMVNKYIDIPEGTWIVETGFFCGKPVCHVMHWGVPALGG